MVSVKEKTKTDSSKDNSDAEGSTWLELFSLFVHDLESPLSSMKYILRLLDENKLDLKRDGHAELVLSSRIAVDRAESILYDILAVAKAGRAGLPVEMETLKVGSIIQETAALIRGSAMSNEITIVTEDQDDFPLIKADPKLLRRMIDNLLFNALRHTPSGGTIKLYTENGTSKFTIHIKDDGPGLGDVATDELFDKFGQADLRREGKHRGVGLGLYFCKLAATGMGGIVMADDHPDGGAVFSIILTKAQEKES